MKVKVVLVEWSDSYFENGWRKKGDFRLASSKCISTGILLNKTRDDVTLVSSHSDEDTYGDAITIPRKVISKLEIIKEFDWSGIKEK